MHDQSGECCGHCCGRWILCWSCDHASVCVFFFSSRRRHTRFDCDWSSDVCSSDLVRTRELTRQQAYMLSSTAVDLHINQLVDVPNFLVSAFLHLDVFQDDDGDEEGK